MGFFILFPQYKFFRFLFLVSIVYFIWIKKHVKKGEKGNKILKTKLRAFNFLCM